MLYIAFNGIAHLLIDFYQFGRQDDFLDELESILIQSRIYSLILLEAISNFVVELDSFRINIHIHISQLFEHVLQHIETLLVSVETCQMEAISVIGLNWAH